MISGDRLGLGHDPSRHAAAFGAGAERAARAVSEGLVGPGAIGDAMARSSTRRTGRVLDLSPDAPACALKATSATRDTRRSRSVPTRRPSKRAHRLLPSQQDRHRPPWDVTAHWSASEGIISGSRRMDCLIEVGDGVVVPPPRGRDGSFHPPLRTTCRHAPRSSRMVVNN